MALTYSQKIPFGKKAPDFSLPGIDGKIYSLASFGDKKILVVVFMCNHCPYVQACWDQLIALQKEFGERKVQFVGINSNDATQYPEDSFEMMKKYAAERSHNFPYLRDESQEVAKAYGAACTPDIFVYDENRELVYHGQMNDKTLETLLKNEKSSQNQNPSMGCSIKWK
jgi:peroxiredoxin